MVVMWKKHFVAEKLPYPTMLMFPVSFVVSIEINEALLSEHP